MKRTMISLGLPWMVGLTRWLRSVLDMSMLWPFEHDLVYYVDDSIVGIFLLLLFNSNKLPANCVQFAISFLDTPLLYDTCCKQIIRWFLACINIASPKKSGSFQHQKRLAKDLKKQNNLFM